MHYTAYGLVFDSELELPEFRRADSVGDADVRIVAGVVPEHLANPTASGVLYELSAEEFLLHVPDVASYLVTSDQIVVQKRDSASEHEARVFMLGSAIGALLHLRRLLVLHAAAFTFDGGAVLLAGPSGAGKSTLLSALIERGYPMVVDDVCAIDLVGDQLRVLPGYGRTRLWADSAKELAIDVAPLHRTRPTLEKYERHVAGSFDPEPRPMRALYLLRSHGEELFETDRLSSIEAFQAVCINTYRSVFLDGLEMRDEHFRLATAIASTVPVTRVFRPTAGFELDRLADIIEDDLGARV